MLAPLGAGVVHLTPHIPPPERWEPYLARCAAPPQRGRTSLASVLTQGTGRAGHSPASARRCCRGRRARKTQSGSRGGGSARHRGILGRSWRRHPTSERRGLGRRRCNTRAHCNHPCWRGASSRVWDHATWERTLTRRSGSIPFSNRLHQELDCTRLVSSQIERANNIIQIIIKIDSLQRRESSLRNGFAEGCNVLMG